VKTYYTADNTIS